MVYKKALALPFGLLVLVGSTSSAEMPTIDLTVHKSVVDVVAETKKTATSASDILDTVNDTKEAIGAPGEIYSSGLDWINGTGRLANQALNSCGLKGIIPNLNIQWPGVDLGDLDLSCLSSAVDFVEKTYEKVDRVKPEDLSKLGLRPGQTQQQKVIENRKGLYSNSTKIALATSLRSSQQASQTSSDLLGYAENYKDESSQIVLTRMLISTQMKMIQELSELRAIMTTYVKMEAAKNMQDVFVDMNSGDEPSGQAASLSTEMSSTTNFLKPK